MKKEVINRLKLVFDAVSENEALARTVVTAFCAAMDVTLSELSDVRCAVSEAVTNAIVHGYGGGARGCVTLLATLYGDRSVKIVIRDSGVGIADIAVAMQPLYTTDKSGERSGMGFAVMQSFMDTVRVRSKVGGGTSVELKKRFSPLPSREDVL